MSINRILLIIHIALWILLALILSISKQSISGFSILITGSIVVILGYLIPSVIGYIIKSIFTPHSNKLYTIITFGLQLVIVAIVLSRLINASLFPNHIKDVVTYSGVSCYDGKDITGGFLDGSIDDSNIQDSLGILRELKEQVEGSSYRQINIAMRMEWQSLMQHRNDTSVCMQIDTVFSQHVVRDKQWMFQVIASYYIHPALQHMNVVYNCDDDTCLLVERKVVK